MTAAVSLPVPRLTSAAALKGAAAFWLLCALVGQWAFFCYIAAFYGPSTLSGDFPAWARNTMLFKGYQPGDLIGNITFGTHALLAGIIAFGGALQLIPQVRARFPRFHRINGRVFLVTAVGLSLGGFYLVWVRGTGQTLVHNLAITGNGVAILAFAALAYRTARARNFVDHRRWAMRLYLVSNAQWFMRVGFIAWMMTTMGLGIKGLNGEFFLFWTFGCYLVPLAVLELYFRARDRAGPGGRWAMATGLMALTLLMIAGTLGFTMFSLKILSGQPLSFG
jgi:hypothetical protein